MTTTAHERFTQGVFADHGRGADLDEAFEAAADETRDAFGTSGVIPSAASYSAGDVTVVSDVATSAARAQVLGLRDLAPGALEARATAADTLFKRRRVRVNLEDTDALRTPGVLELTEEVEAWTLGLVELEEGEFVEGVEVLRSRSRFKPLASSFTGPKSNTFVVTRKGSDEVLASGATAAEAKREAAALAKAGPVDGQEVYTLEVTQASRRADGNPLVSIERTLVAQKYVVQVSLARLKDPTKLKTSGWLFLGRVAQASVDAADEAAAEPSEAPQDAVDQD
jgi:hypothetical protein